MHALPSGNNVSRRHFLRSASLGVGGLMLGDLPSLRAEGQTARPKSVIMVLLIGGPSHIDMYDMKPDAPVEFRGEFKSIKTSVPGLDVCEHLPRMAKEMKRMSLVRNFRHHNSDHGPADHYMLTGYFPQAGFNPSLSPNNQKPSFGGIIARKLGFGHALDRALDEALGR